MHSGRCRIGAVVSDKIQLVVASVVVIPVLLAARQIPDAAREAGTQRRRVFVRTQVLREHGRNRHSEGEPVVLCSSEHSWRGIAVDGVDDDRSGPVVERVPGSDALRVVDVLDGNTSKQQGLIVVEMARFQEDRGLAVDLVTVGDFGEDRLIELPRLNQALKSSKVASIRVLNVVTGGLREQSEHVVEVCRGQ